MKRLSFLKRLAAARTQKIERARSLRRNRVLRLENLDSRALMVGDVPTLEAIGTQAVIAGSPLMIPLYANDTDSGPLTFSVTNVSDGSKLTAQTTNTNRSLKLTVANFGEMTFELFEDKVPGITSKIIDLVQSGKLDGTFFHRIIDGFMIQGGGFTSSGASIPGVSNFDDQFHIDLQHTSSGLLSMAKAGDDTNSSQFFITDTATRFLDFNHSVFGRLVKGDAVREAISAQPRIDPNNDDNRPITPIVITSASIFSDDDNGVLFLKAPQGATGAVTVTVNVTDSDGNTAARTFTVNIAGENESVYPNNSYPFLNSIPTASTTTGVPAVIQLSAQDVENNQRVFSAEKVGSVNYTFQINASTGQLTVTPPVGFIGTMQIKVKVRQPENVAPNLNDPNELGDRFDSQVLNIDVRPTAPSLNLTAASDSGIASNDGVTNATNLQFAVSGLTTNATIKLYNGNTLIETLTAGGTSVNIPTTQFDATVDGDYVVRVTQTVNGIESLAGTYNLKIDRTGPAQVSPAPPTEAIATKPYNYNAQHPDEGSSGFRYSLANAPAGMTIDPVTGVLTWTPTAAQVGTQTFGIIAKDAAGNSSSPRTASVNVAAAPLVQFILKVTDAQGNPITSIANGGAFELRVFTKDLSTVDAHGLFSAYMDIVYDQTFADLVGPITFNTANYPSTHPGTSSPGLLDEVGAIGQLLTGPPFPGTAEILLFKQAFTAKKSGQLTFESNESDSLDLDTTRYQPNTAAFPKSQIEFGTVTLSIAPTVTAVNDTFNVDEDSQATSLNPILPNDVVTTGTLAGLEITAVGPVSQVGGVASGTVTISGDKKTVLFTPKPNFFGEAKFTYTVKNIDNSTSTAEITVQVAPKNDAPTAVPDTDTVAANPPEPEFVNVLQNDLFTPDAEELLKVTNITTPAQHGTATVVAGGSGVFYKPNADYVGTDTFTYEITDPGGLKSTATVTITVANAAAIPVAGLDQRTVQEDSAATNITVLENDSAGINDTTNTLEITGVQASVNGTVTISSDKKSINYTPKPNFQGVDTFTYTVKDASGAQTTGTVKVTVTNTNDAPTAGADAFTTSKNQSKTLDLLLNDKPDPDPTETFTIEEVTGFSNGGSVEISADKKSVVYTPASGYTGIETFTYKIKDAGGLISSSVTVTMTILDFEPSKITGRVYFDTNGDGKKQPTEVGIGNITIRIIGTSSFDSDGIDKTVVTDSQGRYTFDQLPPGAYTINQVTMNGLSDTRYRVGTQGGSVNGSKISVNLSEGVETLYNDFMYAPPKQLGSMFNSRLASSAKTGFLAAASPGPNGFAWTSATGVWAAFTNLKLTLAANKSSVTITGNDASGAAKTATIPMTSANKVRALKLIGTNYVFQVTGTPTQIFGATSGSGEPGSSTNTRGVSGASGEAGSANLSANDAAFMAYSQSLASQSTNDVAKTRSLTQSAKAADYLYAGVN